MFGLPVPLLPAVVRSLSSDPRTTLEEGFFSSVSLAFPRATGLKLSPILRTPFHWYLLSHGISQTVPRVQ